MALKKIRLINEILFVQKYNQIMNDHAVTEEYLIDKVPSKLLEEFEYSDSVRSNIYSNITGELIHFERKYFEPAISVDADLEANKDSALYDSEYDNKKNIYFIGKKEKPISIDDFNQMVKLKKDIDWLQKNDPKSYKRVKDLVDALVSGEE